MRFLVLNGPNLNMLGQRDPNFYGQESYKSLVNLIKKHAKEKSVSLKIYQSNSENNIISFIQKRYNKYDGIIVNLGAFTHYSYAIRDALELVKCKIVEVHISDIYSREDFRKISVIEDIADFRVIGEGFNGYLKAIDFLIEGGHHE